MYVDKKLSQNAIAKQYGVSGALVSIWIQRHGIPSTHLNVANLNSTGDLWYIVGVMVGDGTFDNSRYGVKLACRDEVFALSFQNSLRKLGLRTHKWVQTFREKPVYIAVARSKNLYHWLKQALNNLEVMPKEFIKDFIRGFYESEGCLYQNPKYSVFQVSFSNTDESLILLVKSLILSKGFKTSLFKHKQHGWGTKPVYTLYVLGPREEKLKFLDWINPCISRKRR